MKRLLTILLSACSLACHASPTDVRAERAIIGECAGESDRAMLNVACCLRNRLKAGWGFAGVFGGRNAVAAHPSKALWSRAARAWRLSAHDVTGGLKYFGCRADRDYFLNVLGFKRVRTVGGVDFYRP